MEFILQHFSTPQQFLIFTLLPFLFISIWAFAVKLHDRSFLDVVGQTICGSILLLNGLIIYQEILGYTVPTIVRIIQMVISTMIIPIGYSYFARKMGRSIKNETTRANWLLILLLLVPSVNISLTPWSGVEEAHSAPFYIQLLLSGKTIYRMSISSLILLLQAICISFRVPHTAQTMKQYGLSFTPAMRSFLIWWVIAIGFVSFTSLMPMEVFAIPVFSWIYFIGYGLLTASIYIHIALRMDIHPIQTEDQEHVNIDEYVRQNKELAERAHRLFLEEKLYLKQGIVIEDVVTMLGTNRSYFTRMMRSEFGMSFNEYVSQERVNYVKEQLRTTDRSIEDISFDAGFGNVSSLIRVFKRFTDTTPEAWRKSLK